MTAAPRTESSALVDWLWAVTGRRDLTLPAPSRDPRAAAVERLLACISAEFADYRAVVAGARETVARNGDQLSGIAESTRRQGTIVRETAAAVAVASHGAANVADSAVELGRFAIAARTAGTRADGGLGEMAAALEAVVASLRDTAGPLDRMAACTHTIGMFLTALGRLSRQAQLLAVNASIEAAHLADAGARFGIVASEVRKLSVSTRDSSADVAGIVAELRDATGRVASAVADSERATAGADRDVAGARAALGATQRAHVDVEGTIEAMSEVAQGQRGALDGVAQAVEGIVRHADEAAAASHTAATLDLTALLDGAERSANAWTIREPAAPNARGGAGDDAVCAWIDGMTGGAASHVLLDDPDPESQRIAAAVRALLDAVNADQRRVLADVIRVAVAIAHNGYAWRTIGDSLQGLRAEIAAVRASVALSAQGASDASALAAKMRALVHDSQRQHDAALAALEGALARIAAIARAVGDIDALVDAMTAAAARADEIMALIDTLSSETDLLSLNAAIEAAHAGELGRAFGVIADEIRSLALSTHESTQTIAGLVADVGSLSASLRHTIANTGDRTRSVTAGAEAVRGAIGELRDAFAVTTARALDVSSIADEQTRALDLVLTNVKRSADAVDADSAAATDKRRLELATLGSRAHAVAARRSIGLTAERIRAFADELAAGVESIIEGAIAGGRLREEALFDLRYREIDGAHAGELARLFDVSRVPSTGFSPKKFATVWDPVIDEPICELLDAAFTAGEWFKPVTMLALDLNAFMYAYPRSLIAPWRGDAGDLAGNRIKRLNEDEYTLRITRWGLGPAVDALATRVTYEQFEAAGCTLARGSGERPWGIYPYLRDTNAVYNGLAIGYYVRGRRHGAVRIIYDPDIL